MTRNPGAHLGMEWRYLLFLKTYQAVENFTYPL
jgi:hypothetical protein